MWLRDGPDLQGPFQSCDRSVDGRVGVRQASSDQGTHTGLLRHETCFPELLVSRVSAALLCAFNGIPLSLTAGALYMG